jgi:hypothetical protein
MVRAVQGEMQAGRISDQEARRRIEVIQRGISDRIQTLDNMLRQFQQRSAASASQKPAMGVGTSKSPDAVGHSVTTQQQPQGSASTSMPNVPLPPSSIAANPLSLSALQSQSQSPPPTTTNTSSMSFPQPPRLNSPKPSNANLQAATAAAPAPAPAPGSAAAPSSQPAQGQSHPIWSGQMACTIGDPTSGNKREIGVYVGIIAMSQRMLAPL